MANIVANKGYAWKCEYTDGIGRPLTGYVISETSTINSGTPLYFVRQWTPGPSITFCFGESPEYHICGATATFEEVGMVDYNKNLGKYIEIEDDEHNYEIINTNLTCADLEETGNTYTLIYHDSDSGEILKGDLTLKYISGDTIYWGNRDIDICLHVFCSNGRITTTYMC